MEYIFFIMLAALMAILESGFVKLAPRSFPQLLHPRTRYRGKPSVTGGGFIFYIAAAAAMPLLPSGQMLPLMAGGVALWTLSFYDDMHDLSPLLRLAVQTVVLGWIMLPAIAMWGVAAYIAVTAASIALVNAYNFMDGIGGMLSYYSIVTLCSLLAWYAAIPVLSALVALPGALLVAVLVFAVYNVVMTDRVFAGDVGSIVMGLFVAWLIFTLSATVGSIGPVAMVSVYLVDVLLTLVRRIFLRQNILHPHHMHLYQRLTVDCRMSHRSVSLLYAGVQLAINTGLMCVPASAGGIYCIAVYALLCALHILLYSIYMPRHCSR